MIASRKRLLDLLDGKKVDQNLGLQATTKTLPVFVKNYNRQNGLSILFHKASTGNSQFAFEGPFVRKMSFILSKY
jgi:hypothetical protein